MADIAQIGIRVDTRDVKEAVQDLKTIPPAANSAEMAVVKLEDAFEEVAKSAEKADDAVSKSNATNSKTSNVAAAAAGALTKESAAAAKVAQAAGAADTSTSKLASSMKLSVDAAGRLRTETGQFATAADKATASALAASGALDKESAAALKAAGAASTAANQNQKLGQSMNGIAGQTGNIAAQFNDIGVQLAGGQSPFLIALQQGTQLNQIFGGQGLSAILGGLGSAFMSLLNPVSLLTIAFITVGGTAIQYFSSLISSSEDSAEKLKEQQDLIRGVAERWGEAVPAIQAYIDQLDRAAEAADLIKAGDILSSKQFDDLRIQVEGANVAFADLVLQLEMAGEKRENIVALDNAFQELRQKVEDGTATSKDMQAVTDALANTVNGSGIPAIDAFSSSFSVLAGSIARAAAQVGNIKKQTAEALRSAQGLGPAQFGMNQPLQYEGAQDASQLVTPTERPNIELAGMPGVNYADASGHIKGAKKPRVKRERKVKSQAELFSDVTEGADRELATLRAQQEAIGLSAEAASKLKRETDLLNQAQAKNITLNEDQKSKLSAIATEMASVEEATRKAKESMDFAKDTTRGFVDDLRSGLESGKGLWESFGDAALGVLDKITDKLLNDVMDAIFTTSSAGGGGKGGGIGGLLGGLFSLFSAKGNVFQGGRVEAFAKGGAFSNSVVSKPTAFAIGQMGEAGPEAIMPLKRGPDGSLGVQSHKGGSGSKGPQTIDLNLHLQDDSGRMSEIAQQEFRTQSGDLVRMSVKTVKQQLPSMMADATRRGATS